LGVEETKVASAEGGEALEDGSIGARVRVGGGVEDEDVEEDDEFPEGFGGGLVVGVVIWVVDGGGGADGPLVEVMEGGMVFVLGLGA
jgi:hypothetical protein